MGRVRIQNKRVCSECGSQTTSSDNWYRDGQGGFFCAKCNIRKYHRSKNPDYRTKKEIHDEITKRNCIECGSNVTGINYRQKTAYEAWYSAEPYGKTGWLCETCRRRIRRHLGLDAPGHTPKVSIMTVEKRSKVRKYHTEYLREMRRLNPEKFREYNRQRHLKIKIKLFQILNQNCCVYCGYALFPALHIDHKAGFGRQDMKRFRNNSILMKEYYIKHPEEAREKLQVCCSNCNWLKKWRNREDASLVILPKQLIKLTNSKAPFSSVDLILPATQP